MKISDPHVGNVLTEDSPEPPDGTPLLDGTGRVEKYASADIGGRWRRYAQQLGPFVVAPDCDLLVHGRGNLTDLPKDQT